MATFPSEPLFAFPHNHFYNDLLKCPLPLEQEGIELPSDSVELTQ